MSKIYLPADFNYIGAFLTFTCPLRCSYCINHFNGLSRRETIKPERWIRFINSLELPPDLPVTLQGGEPTFYPGFYTLVKEINRNVNLDLMTNLQFNVSEFMRRVSPDRFKRSAKYASIRVSFHEEQMDFNALLNRTLRLQREGYSIGIWEIALPDSSSHLERQKHAIDLGIDYRLKDYLGFQKGKLYGNYRYPDSTSGNSSHCSCRTSELLVAPDGIVHRCHSDLYTGRPGIGRITSPSKLELGRVRDCEYFGQCNPCDVKIKTNRFQEFGHTSVEITNITPQTSKTLSS